MNDSQAVISEGRRLRIPADSLLQALTIIPTAWNIFVGAATMLGVVELLGPVVRYLVRAWQSLTRGFWNLLFDFVYYDLNLSLDIVLRDSDKDALTFCVFFALFGASMVPESLRLAGPRADPASRRVDWKIFPLAFVISSTVVGIVSFTTSSITFDPQHRYGQFFVFIVFFFLIYGLISFLPLFVAYLIDLGMDFLRRKQSNQFKIIYAIVIPLYACTLAVLTYLFHASLNMHGSAAINTLMVLFLCLVPMAMPIIQPYKLVRLLLISGLFTLIAFASHYLDLLRQSVVQQ